MILKQGFNAETAVTQIFNQYEMRLAAVENEYLRERAEDIGEVKRRVLDVLADTSPSLECEHEEHWDRGEEAHLPALPSPSPSPSPSP